MGRTHIACKVLAPLLTASVWGGATSSEAQPAPPTTVLSEPDYEADDAFSNGWLVEDDGPSSGEGDGDLTQVSDPEGDSGDEEGNDGGGAGVEEHPDVCHWQTSSGDFEDTVIEYVELNGGTVPPKPSPTSVLRVQICGEQESIGLMSVEWVEPGEEGDPTADLLDTVYARVAGNLPVPELGANPRLGGAAVVNWPTFVRVENWTGVFTDQGCNGSGDFCVYVEATPTMTFDPGDGSDPVECQGQGELYDPGSVESPWEQAEWDETCTHIYRQRTGVDGRPEAWPGVVSVTWAITYTSDSGDSGTLEPVTHSADLAREVQERQAIVTD